LCEDNKIINNSNEVSNLFNNFFATVAEKIGENVVYCPSNHPSIIAIHENNSIELNGKFGFQKVTSEKVEKIIKKTNVKKATDKIVKASKSVIAPQLSTLINITVDTCVFPDKLKKKLKLPHYLRKITL
jgi:hypothetical protein